MFQYEFVKYLSKQSNGMRIHNRGQEKSIIGYFNVSVL